MAVARTQGCSNPCEYLVKECARAGGDGGRDSDVTVGCGHVHTTMAYRIQDGSSEDSHEQTDAHACHCAEQGQKQRPEGNHDCLLEAVRVGSGLHVYKVTRFGRADARIGPSSERAIEPSKCAFGRSN